MTGAAATVSVAGVTARLKRLKIVKFRGVRPGTELHFNDGWNVLLGQNATGKTTLLNLISMALRGDFKGLGEEPFDIEYLLQWGPCQAEVSITHTLAQPLPKSLASPRTLAEGHTPSLGVVQWRVLVTEPQGKTLLTNVSQGDPSPDTPTRTVLSPVGASPLNLRFALQFDEGSTVAFDAHAMWSFRFDEALDTLRSLFGDEGDSLGLPSAKHSVGVQSSTDTFVFAGLTPHLSTWEADEHHEGSITAFRGLFTLCQHLNWVTSKLGGNELDATYPITQIRQQSQAYVEADLGPPTFLLRRADGTATSIRNLSFGQRRLFTFAWYLDSNPGPVVADELVNGMHYEWIEDCVRAMEGRQIFVTAQNPLLLDHVPFTSPADVTHSFVLCRAAPTPDGRREVVWSHPTESQAAEFFRAYENGVLRVHEILRTEGLW